MPNPSVSTITIDGDEFNALSTHFGVSTNHDHTGMPMTGTVSCNIHIEVDMHDTVNLPFTTLQKLFTIASTVTKDSIKDIKIVFWKDENQNDAICTYSFRGWISDFSNNSGGGSNHTLNLSIQPELGSTQILKISIEN
ncbi:MAG: hypothetical protein ABR905_07800 [Terracidiphilus sp.]